MSPKKHEIAWHKKKGKFIPSSFLKPHHSEEDDDKQQQRQNRRQEFMKSLSEKVKKAIKPLS